MLELGRLWVALFIFCISSNGNLASKVRTPLCGNAEDGFKLENISDFHYSQETRPVGPRNASPEEQKSVFIPDLGHTNGVKIVKVFRILQKGGTPAAQLPSNQEYLDNYLDEVSFFFSENSNQKLEVRFEFHDQFLTTSSYSKLNCESTDSECAVSSPQFPSLMKDGNNYHYMYIFEDYCTCLKYRGLGQVLNQVTWINGAPDVLVAAHELGHNLGASHANFIMSEYGNYYSVMGAGSKNFGSHFTVAGKTQFKWLTHSSTGQVRTVARENGCFDVFDAVAESCTEECTEEFPCEFEVFSHDTSDGYADDRLYGLRVASSDPRESVWLEYRTRYDELSQGLIALWSYESDFSKNFISHYGPTQLLDYRLAVDADKRPSDSLIRPGEIWVYDLDHTGLVVEVLGTTANPASVTFSLYFLTNVASSYSYNTEGTLFTRNIAAELSPSMALGENLDSNELHCGIKKTVNFNAAANRYLFHFKTIEETSLSLLVKGNCSKFKPGKFSGAYFYPTYPLQLELNEDFDPRVGALGYGGLSCDDSGTFSYAGVGGFNRTKLDVKKYISPSRTSSFPAFIDFSTDNYILLYVNFDEFNAVSQDVSVGITIATSETSGCYSPCSTVIVSANLPIHGEYNIQEESSTTSYIHDNFEYILKAENGVWSFVHVKTGKLVASQITGTTSTNPYPHVVSNWTVPLTVDCDGRIIRNHITTATNEQILVNSTIIIMVIAVLASFVVMLGVQLKHKYEDDLSIYQHQEDPKQQVAKTSRLQVFFNKLDARTAKMYFKHPKQKRKKTQTQDEAQNVSFFGRFFLPRSSSLNRSLLNDSMKPSSESSTTSTKFPVFFKRTKHEVNSSEHIASETPVQAQHTPSRFTHRRVSANVKSVCGVPDIKRRSFSEEIGNSDSRAKAPEIIGNLTNTTKNNGLMLFPNLDMEVSKTTQKPPKRRAKRLGDQQMHMVYRLEFNRLNRSINVSAVNYSGDFMRPTDLFSSPTKGFAILAVICLPKDRRLTNYKSKFKKLSRYSIRTDNKTFTSVFGRALVLLVQLGKQHRDSALVLGRCMGDVRQSDFPELRIIGQTESHLLSASTTSALHTFKLLDISNVSAICVSVSAQFDDKTLLKELKRCRDGHSFVSAGKSFGFASFIQ